MQLRSIQALRAFAALAVLVCHLRAIEHAQASGPVVMTDVWINGASGVDFFFVISGFIMVWVAGETDQTLRGTGQFLFARVTRIYPLWWLFASILALYFFVTYGEPWETARIEPTLSAGFWHLLKSALLLPQSVHPVLGVGWTLVHEMYFYIAFGVLILLCPARFRLMGLLVWAAIVIVGSLLTPTVGHAGTLLQLAVFPMTLEFILGALIAYAIRAGARAYALSSLLVGLIAYILIFVDFSFMGNEGLLKRFGWDASASFALSWGRTLLFGLPAGAIVYGLVSLELQHGLKRVIPDLAVRIGDWSYALYLSHIIVISAVATVFFPLFGHDGLSDNWAFLVLAAISAIVFSGLTFHFFERPLLNWFAAWRSTLFQKQTEIART